MRATRTKTVEVREEVVVCDRCGLAYTFEEANTKRIQTVIAEFSETVAASKTMDICGACAPLLRADLAKVRPPPEPGVVVPVEVVKR